MGEAILLLERKGGRHVDLVERGTGAMVRISACASVVTPICRAMDGFGDEGVHGRVTSCGTQDSEDLFVRAGDVHCQTLATTHICCTL